MGAVTMILSYVKKNLTKTVFILITAVLITVTAIVFEANFFKILPLYISLVVMMLQSEANRLGHLMGALNSILYAVVYYSLELYATAISSLFLSFPMALITFFTWKRKAYKKSVVFKKMSTKVRIYAVLCAVLLWSLIYLLLRNMGSEFLLLDNTSMILGIAVSLLTMFAFVEYSYVGILHIIISLALKLQLTASSIANLPFLVYTCYNTVCHVRSLINVRRLYNEQNRSKKQKESISATTD